MPTKPNRAGQQQNYVPAGHGDASGEYGDNVTGSNVHIKFTNFKKPEETSNNKIGIEQTGFDKINYNGKQYSQEEITKIIMNSMGYSKKSINVDRVLKQLEGENINPEIKSLVLDTLASGNYRVVAVKNGAGYFSPSRYGGGGIHFASTGESDSYANGETLFHEVGHAIDYTYKENSVTDTWSLDYKSKKYNKTLIEMKDEELGEFLKNGGFEKILEDYRKDLDGAISEEDKKIIDAYTKARDEFKTIRNNRDKALAENKEYQELEAKHDEMYQNRWQLFGRDYEAFKKANNEFIEAKQKIADSVEYDGKDVFKEKEKIASDLYEGYWKSKEKVRSLVSQKYMDLSDMCQAIDLKYKFHGGHDNTYFKNSKGNQATECFAEINSAIGTNKLSLETLKKYIPKTIEIYKEIVEGLKNGK